MAELPISDEAVETAGRCLWRDQWETLGGPEPSDEEDWTEHGGGYEQEARLVIQAFLAAEGFEVEGMAPDPRSATRFTPHRRLVSSWQPIPEQGTDPPSTEQEQ